MILISSKLGKKLVKLQFLLPHDDIGIVEEVAEIVEEVRIMLVETRIL